MSPGSSDKKLSLTLPSSPASPWPLIDDWEGWPDNHPKFDPIFDNMSPLREEFCECKRFDCTVCDETREVFHVSEYAAGGQTVFDKKVNTTELHDHLLELERLDGSDDLKTADHPSFRLFFACGNYVDGGLRFAYMRRFFAHWHLPPQFVHKQRDNDVVPIFQASYEPHEPSGTQSDARPGTLHIYMQSHIALHNATILRNSEYYSAEFAPRVRSYVETATYTIMSPVLYLRYDIFSGESVAYIADSTVTFDLMRQIYSSGVHEVKQDPFLIVTAFLQQRIADLRNHSREMRDNLDNNSIQSLTMLSLDSNSSSTLFAQLNYVAADGPVIARMRHEASSIVRAIGSIEAAHRLFYQRNYASSQGATVTAHLVKARLRGLLVLAKELESAYGALEAGVRIIKDLLVGRAQVINGLDMSKLAKDNQKQAEATEALARDARRDSEIMKRDSATMKTITVVTLVYLPATFVSTLLSMGIFDFGVGEGNDSGIRIAREGWVFIAISLPLTVITLGLAFLWKLVKERQWQREAETVRAEATRTNVTASLRDSLSAAGGTMSDRGKGISKDGEGALGRAGNTEGAASRGSYTDCLKARLRLRVRHILPRDLEIGQRKS